MATLGVELALKRKKMTKNVNFIGVFKNTCVLRQEVTARAD